MIQQVKHKLGDLQDPLFNYKTLKCIYINTMNGYQLNYHFELNTYIEQLKNFKETLICKRDIEDAPYKVTSFITEEGHLYGYLWRQETDEEYNQRMCYINKEEINSLKKDFLEMLDNSGFITRPKALRFLEKCNTMMKLNLNLTGEKE